MNLAARKAGLPEEHVIELATVRNTIMGPSSGQLVKQRLGLFKIERIEPLGEPAIDRSARRLAIFSAHRRAKLPRLCFLLTRDVFRANANAKIRLSQPASRTTPRITPITPATTSPNTAIAMREGRKLSSFAMISGGPILRIKVGEPLADVIRDDNRHRSFPRSTRGGGKRPGISAHTKSAW